ncbi:MAG: FprA family A-type flavoprotein [Clostridia bacterium]|nr:FprA family A-type flavoprotein [Clostridia bacterium]
MNITKDIKYIGVNDCEIDLFEGQYPVPNGMAYNSYLIIDEKIAVIDTVEKRFTNVWLEKLEAELSGKSPDYLIVQHMEPDHSGSIKAFCEKYPKTVVVANAKAFNMVKNFFGTDLSQRQMAVGENDTLNLGKHTLTFITAPMVHWPEVIMTYDSTDKVLFSADAFGKFGSFDCEEEWKDEARRYYIGIVGKYGVQVNAVLKKAAGLDIQKICALHGPVLSDNLGYYVDLYSKWASYEAEEKGVLIAYTSIYGNTREAALLLADKLNANGVKNEIFDLARCDIFEAVAKAFKYDKLVLATTTYNTDIFPFMRTFIEYLTARNFQNRKVAFIENGSWGPMATKVMRNMLENSKSLTLCENNVTILSGVDDATKTAITTLANELSE